MFSTKESADAILENINAIVEVLVNKYKKTAQDFFIHEQNANGVGITSNKCLES